MTTTEQRLAEIRRLTEKAESDDNYWSGIDADDYIRDCKLLLSLVEQYRKDAEWRPIETAPKDGTIILIGKYTDTGYDGPRWWWITQGSFDADGFSSDWCDENYPADQMVLYRGPTHWMPLPEHPQAIDRAMSDDQKEQP